MTSTPDEKAYRRGWWAWALYDVGNSAFWLVIAAAVFPVYYQELYVQSQTKPGQVLTLEAEQELKTKGRSKLGYTAAIAMGIVSVLGPVLGRSPTARPRKEALAFFAGLGVIATALMLFIGRGRPPGLDPLPAGDRRRGGSMVFYDALLPAVAREERSRPRLLLRVRGGISRQRGAVHRERSDARFAPEVRDERRRPGGADLVLHHGDLVGGLHDPAPPPREGAPVEAGGRRRRQHLGGVPTARRDVPQAQEVQAAALFLIAFWIYSDGIGTIIKMATAFGNSLGVGRNDLMIALVVTQIVGVPCALAFGSLAKRIGAKTGILIGLGAYAAICGFAAFMKESWHFYVLAIAVGLVQGGTQSLSRSLFATMIPKGQSGEFFGFFSTMEKFAGILGPLLLGLLWGEGGDPRTGIVALAVFFILGMVIPRG
jgi:UMF1 family MFS transporter